MAEGARRSPGRREAARSDRVDTARPAAALVLVPGPSLKPQQPTQLQQQPQPPSDLASVRQSLEPAVLKYSSNGPGRAGHRRASGAGSGATAAFAAAFATAALGRGLRSSAATAAAAAAIRRVEASPFRAGHRGLRGGPAERTHGARAGAGQGRRRRARGPRVAQQLAGMSDAQTQEQLTMSRPSKLLTAFASLRSGADRRRVALDSRNQAALPRRVRGGARRAVERAAVAVKRVVAYNSDSLQGVEAQRELLREAKLW